MSLVSRERWLAAMTWHERINTVAKMIENIEDKEKEDLVALLKDIHYFLTYPITQNVKMIEDTVAFWQHSFMEIDKYLTTLVQPDLIKEDIAVESFLSKDLYLVQNWCAENGYKMDFIFSHSQNIPEPLTDVIISV